ncbi:MAG: GNAT family N-acetyltransferase [Caldilineaceae bacterium]
MNQQGPQYVTLQPIFDQLYGERIILRPYRLPDAAAFQAAIVESRDHLRPWEWFGDAFHTLEQTQDWIIRRQVAWLLRDSFTCGIWQRATGRLLGNIELAVKQWWLPWFTIAYWVRQSEACQGYVSEAVRLLTDYAFEELGAKRVELNIAANNVRSIAVAERLGFHLDGRLRNVERENDGELVDQLCYSLTPEDLRWSQAARFRIAEWDDSHPAWSHLLSVIEQAGQHNWVNARYPWHRTSHLLVATQGSTIVGFLRLVTQAIGADEELPPTLLDGEGLIEGKVMAFGVGEAHRRQGIGRALQEAALGLAQRLGCYQLRSHSSGSNPANHQLKLSMGFAIQRIIRGEDRQGAYFIMPLQWDGNGKENL